MAWWLKILISLGIKTLFAYIYPKIDVELYYEILEQKIEKSIKVWWFWEWLFTKQDVKVFGVVYKQAVPRYRIFHVAAMAGYWVITWIFFYQLVYSSIWLCLLVFFVDIVLGVGYAYYKMLFERLYYTISDTIADLVRYQREGEDVYWLKRWWFYGNKCFRISFQVNVFDESAFLGWIGMYFTSAIYLILFFIL